MGTSPAIHIYGPFNRGMLYLQFCHWKFLHKKLCTDFCRQKLNFTAKNSKITFCATLWGLRDTRFIYDSLESTWSTSS